MKVRILGVWIVVALVLALTMGFAYRGTASTMSRPTMAPGLRQAMEAMHDSPAMRAMHDRMPERLQQQCDALHDQMHGAAGATGGMMGSGAGMMQSGAGMMGG
jgi:hypothetical protein